MKFYKIEIAKILETESEIFVSDAENEWDKSLKSKNIRHDTERRIKRRLDID